MSAAEDEDSDDDPAPKPGMDDEDDDMSGPDEPQNFFAGGEKSGLSVQNPNSGKKGHSKLVSSLLKKAEACAFCLLISWSATDAT